VRGDKITPSPGYLCVERVGCSSEQHEHPARLRAARSARRGTFAPIASESAMDEVAARLQAIIARGRLRRRSPSTPARTGLFSAGQAARDRVDTGNRSPWYFTPNTSTTVAADGVGAARRVDAGVQRFFTERRRHAVRRQQSGLCRRSRARRPALRECLQVPARRRAGAASDHRRRPARTELAKQADVHLQCARARTDPARRHGGA